jgi:hypothetical protein
VERYRYDARNLLLSEIYSPGQATPGSSTTPPLDQRVYVYDAARRLASRSDQAGVLTTYDRKLSVVTSPKAQKQMARQQEALKKNGREGRWEVPTEGEKARADKMIQKTNSDRITSGIADQ